MKSIQTTDGFFLVFSRGEELISMLKEFCDTSKVHWAQFSAIGAVEDVEIGYYDLEKRQYFFRQEHGPFEVTNLDGNVTELNEAPLIHAHGVLSRCDETLSCIGGHIRRAVVAVTLELCMRQISQPLLREYDDQTGLNLIAL